MARLLYVKSSPRGDRSYSLAVADAFVQSYRESHPMDEVVTLNLFDMNLPEFDGHVIESKYVILHGKKHTPEQLAAWKAVEEIISQFKSADKYVFAVPMWNFSIPYKLKHYIDILAQPTYTFSYSPEEGYTGLVTGKPVLVAYARGGEYIEGTPAESFDFQTRYFELILGFMGLTDITKVIVGPTLNEGPDVAQSRRQEAIAKAREIAGSF